MPVNYQSLFLKNLEKEEQNKHEKPAEKINNKNSKINDVESRKTIEKINEI